jgi:hypothetical protein
MAAGVTQWNLTPIRLRCSPRPQASWSLGAFHPYAQIIRLRGLLGFSADLTSQPPTAILLRNLRRWVPAAAPRARSDPYLRTGVARTMKSRSIPR